jgi:hypothetical protein
MRYFHQAACVDWSGALGERPPGIAVASAIQGLPPSLIRADHRWSRQDVMEWILDLANAQTDIIIGLDLSFGFPFLDENSYFPGWPQSPGGARRLWMMIDNLCEQDPHLSAPSFLNHPELHRHFRHSKDDVGDLFTGGIGRLRAVEHHQRETKQANSWSCFNLVGAGQVGKSSLTGMRMLNRLKDIPIWPFDPVPETGPVIVEIYTAMAARAAGLPANRSKIRDHESLASALSVLGYAVPESLLRHDDHATDAILTAAWLQESANNPMLWLPEKLNSKICATEGWTFGVI